MRKFYRTAKGWFIDVKCPDCERIHSVSHKNYYAQYSGKRNLSFRCAKCGRLSGAKTRRNPHLRKATQTGYMKIYRPENPMADKRGEVYEHRLVMAEHLGRPLHRYEHVHHKDGNRAHNVIENLELVTNSENQAFKDMLAHIRHLESLLRKHNIAF